MKVWTFLAKKYHPKTSLYNTFMAPWQYWLGKAKLKSSFSATQNTPKKLLQNFKTSFKFLLTSDKHNLITANAVGLTFALFNVTSVQQVLFGIPQYVHAYFMDLLVSFFVAYLSLLTVQSVDLW